jgi:hypothetical protein
MPKAKKKAGNKKPLKPIFHIFCEGKKTEPYYIKGYINHFHSDKKRLLVVENANKNTPVQLVKEAIEHKAKSNKGDVYWVVFDRESVSKYSHELHLKARKTAKDNGIEIAFSNVCFEYWLLLHLEYSTASYESCDDLLKHSSLKKRLAERGVKNYDKGYAYLFDKLKADNGIQNAKMNAAKVMKNALNTAQHGKRSPCYLNPYTDVHELLADMQNFIDGQKSVREGKY